MKVQTNELGHKTNKEKDLQAEKMARENEGKEIVEVKTKDQGRASTKK